MLIKGESSYWVNKQNLLETKFSWQDDYWAASICDSHIETLKKYIRNQDAHHSSKSFSEEIDEVMKSL
jgi:putative transposase